MKRQLARAVQLFKEKGIREAARRIMISANRRAKASATRLLARPVVVPMNYLGSTAPLNWIADSTSTRNLYRFTANEDGIRIRSDRGDNQVHLVCRGTGADLRKLSSNAGFKVIPGAEYEIGFTAHGVGVRVHLTVIEFNLHRQRVADTRVAPGKTLKVTLNPNTHHLLLVLRVQGKGDVTVSQLNIAARLGDRVLVADALPETDSEHVSGANPAGRTLHGVLFDLAMALPKSNGVHFMEPVPLRVGIVTDIYMYNFYKGAFADYIYLSPNDVGRLDDLKLDAFMYISSWAGINNDEWRGVKFRERPSKAMDAILAHCKKNGVKTVFQSIEDPSNFEYFLPLSKLFDTVFTSDTDNVARYKEELGHDRVFYAEYGVNPRLQNPIGSRRHKLNAAFFAGSWAARYTERCEDMRTIFDTIVDSGGELIIADRNENSSSESLRYPAEYRSRLIPPFEHELLQNVHKLFRYNLNFNSIKSSPTMCAMRVYELQAMGVGIISNYARSVFNRFPEISIVPARQDLMLEFGRPDFDRTIDEYETAMTCVRNVMTDKTNVDIAHKVMRAAGFDNLPERPKPVIAVLHDCSELPARVLDQQGAKVIAVGAGRFAKQAVWTKFARENGIQFFTWYCPDDEWEAAHLIDLVNGFKYTASGYVTRSAWYAPTGFVDGPQHEYVEVMPGKARTLFSAKIHSPIKFLELNLHQALHLPDGYSIDPFQLNHERCRAEINRGKKLEHPALSVIVPVHNNGRFLLNKAIPSLQRNRIWPEMEILLVDDGSTDPLTLKIEDQLAARYPNVRLHRTDEAASGSASRPRNIGIELARSSLISFLDPDNEISAGGYDRLLEMKQELADAGQNVDFVSGYHLKVEQQAHSIGKHTNERVVVMDELKSAFFGIGRFSVIPTQPAIMARELFENEHLRFVEGAAGQDTLFGWELLCQATRGAFTSEVFLIYYPERADSVTNVIGKIYFEKHLKLEFAQLEMLKRNGLLDSFMENHFEKFSDGWYLKKLELVRDQSEREYCERILTQIAALYSKKVVLGMEST